MMIFSLGKKKKKQQQKKQNKHKTIFSRDKINLLECLMLENQQ